MSGAPLVETLCEDARWEAAGLDVLAERGAEAALRRLGLDPARYEISLLGCNDARIADLNADFRGKPQPTNVLSWPSAERAAARPGELPRLPPPSAAGPVALGDIAIAFETCQREAEEAGRPLAHHALHLVVHATLHLLGFDHDHEADAELMERIESEIVTGLGLADPYGPLAEGAATEGTPQDV
ncbi:rRNA maturation RNase YbeY [Rubellimicrobium sp. CFH 75288]|uniref:rRNA maturation RNase YbeY n=1 Tax=Rubellimicrobium sp. CFH 75288 TaxID=2697034 RepID=UPI00141219B2|nr:rRNA maturation RNase YbeY [Rubellimicrobium sp. CFH 75288]NAZ36110.1 rRNA maturation RNase YbeY [Rubellimicrobium sp. CFH 75288]